MEDEIRILLYKDTDNIATETDNFYFVSGQSKLSKFDNNELQKKNFTNKRENRYIFLSTLCFSSRLSEESIIKKVHEILPRMRKDYDTLELALLKGAIRDERDYIKNKENKNAR